MNPPRARPIFNPQAVAGGVAPQQERIGSVAGVPESGQKNSPLRTAAGQYLTPIVPISVPIGQALPTRLLAANPNRLSVLLRMNTVTTPSSGAASLVLLGGPGARLPDSSTGKGILVQGFEAPTLDTTDEIWCVNIGAVAAVITGVEIVSSEVQA